MTHLEKNPRGRRWDRSFNNVNKLKHLFYTITAFPQHFRFSRSFFLPFCDTHDTLRATKQRSANQNRLLHLTAVCWGEMLTWQICLLKLSHRGRGSGFVFLVFLAAQQHSRFNSLNRGHKITDAVMRRQNLWTAQPWARGGGGTHLGEGPCFCGYRWKRRVDQLPVSGGSSLV